MDVNVVELDRSTSRGDAALVPVVVVEDITYEAT